MTDRDADGATPKPTDTIRAFYDRHPYPPPVDDLDAYRERWDNPERRRADFHLFWPTRPYTDDLNILVAGCGTSQAAKHALRRPDARVVGIDLSETSIRHTEELKSKYGLTNLEVRQLPVERVGELGRDFDHIVCTGVLHHLPDPDAGLRALRDVLRPDGAMHAMVYATYGRAGVYMIQEYARRLGLGRSDQEIEDLAATLASLPQGHPLRHVLQQAPDFRTRAGLADALLHPQDRAYTVPQFLDFVDGAGLTFGRWVRQAPYLPHCGDLARSPHAARLQGLPEREQYAAAELFRGTMVRHSAVLYRSDCPSGGQQVRFDGDDWPGCVPVRLPNTICVEERLTEGAVAVLLNQSHTYPDLYLPIDAGEKRLFDAIDGQRAVAEIMHDPDPHFFVKLLQHDQIVVDASHTPSAAGR